MARETIECVLPELCEHFDMVSALRFRSMARWFTAPQQHNLFAQSLLRSWLAQVEHPQWKQRSEVCNLLTRLASPSRFDLTELQSTIIVRRPASLPILDCITATVPAIAAGCPEADQLTNEEANGLVVDALTAITNVAERGDKVAIEFASRWVEHGDGEIQRVAARLLGIVANVGDKEVVRTLLHQFDDDANAELRLAKVVALQRVAEVGDEDVITCLCNCLGKRAAGDDARYAALTALNHLVTVGSEAVVTRLCDLLKDRYEPQEMRLATIEMIRTMAPKGDRTALSALLCCMQDVNPYREADEDVNVTIALTCAEVVHQLAAVGDVQVVGTLEASLQRSRVVEEVRDEMLHLLEVLRIN
jgi:hypothetical protein